MTIETTRRPAPGLPIRVLFVCTGNSARSVLAEALLRHRGGPDFEVSSGHGAEGDQPLDAARALRGIGVDASFARSKSVTEFLDEQFDYVVTVCDQARQACPVFPGAHESLHWGLDESGRRGGHRRGEAGRLPADGHRAGRPGLRPVHHPRPPGARRDGRPGLTVR